MKTSGKIFLTFLGGAAAGALAGLLFAPESGKKTREQITKKANEISKNIKENLEHLTPHVRDLV
ncbi:YtxH domain-containing protein [Fulvivirgaceae bacterium BMA10]|uniref:YtxH domain-containing protein n=1 Tax=Splendidivirga corallicola TaxID=3051826 RepID=A0ABT8KRH7_9BACT|nr:YtxH domain-containing protein [Fulvivirgaceae bacterium BMA10]